MRGWGGIIGQFDDVLMWRCGDLEMRRCENYGLRRHLVFSQAAFLNKKYKTINKE
jgi:hypothetical protein